MNDRPQFIVDQNIGKLTKLLRLLGYDTKFFTGETDAQLVEIAQKESRNLLTRDTHILERRAITSGRVKALLLGSGTIENQIRQVVSDLHLDNFQPFTICLEDNRPLIARAREEVKNQVPIYVWKTQPEYVECPECHRIYWKGTHWGAMTLRLEKLTQYIQKELKWNFKDDTSN